MRYIILLLFFILNTNAFSFSLLDSLDIEINNCKSDSSLISLYFSKANSYSNNNNVDSSNIYLQKALIKAEEIQDSSSIAKVFAKSGVNNYNTSKFQTAIEYMLKSIEIFAKLDKPSELSDQYNNLGLTYIEIGNNENAIKYIQKSLEIKTELEEDYNVALAYLNLGVVYLELNKDSMALYYIEKPLAYFSNIHNTKDSIEARRGMAFCYNNIAQIYENQHQYEKASKYLYQALEYLIKLDDKYNISLAYINISSLSLKISATKNIEEKEALYKSIEYAIKEAKSISKEVSDLKNLSISYGLEADYAVAINNYKRAYLSFVKYSELNDSIFNIEKIRAIEDVEAKYQLEKKQVELDKNKIELKKNSIDIGKKDFLIKIAILIVLVFIILILLIILAYRKIKKSHYELRKTNTKINEINFEIIDSLNLANHLQKAIIKGSRGGKSHFLNYFSFVKPKQIVGGDFVWSKVINGKVVVAVVDCVGHGVPGAMVSMLSVGLLNEIIQSDKDLIPNNILNKIREQIINNVIDDNQDLGLIGLDVSLAIYDIRTKSLKFSGANLPIYIASKSEKILDIDHSCINRMVCQENNMELIEIKGDKMPVGSHIVINDFTSHEIQLEEGDMVYMFTDGYADQFGGPKGKKFKYKPFKHLLLSNSHKNMKLQKEALKDTFYKYKGSCEQVDDITVIGIRI